MTVTGERQSMSFIGFYVSFHLYDVINDDDAGTWSPSLSARAAPTVWQSYAHATAVKADSSYTGFIQDREALATKPVYEVHVSFSENPQHLLEAPVTELDVYKMDDVKVNPDARPVEEIHQMIRHVTALVESFQLPGSIALCWGVDIEDETRVVTLGGWRSTEVRLLGHSLHSFPFLQRVEQSYSF